jgi:hypothetical protein
MAAPAWVKSSAGTVMTTTTATPSLASVTIGNLIVLQVCVDGNSQNTAITDTNSTIEALDGTDNTMTQITVAAIVGASIEGRQALFMGRALATTVSVDVTGDGTDSYMQLHEFSGVNTGTSINDVFENGTAGFLGEDAGTSVTVADVAVVTTGADRLACNFIAIGDDNAPVSFTGETGGDWALVASFGSATGTDGEVGLQTATIAAAGTINGGTYTQAIDPWGVLGFALIPAASSNTYAKSGFGRESAT